MSHLSGVACGIELLAPPALESGESLGTRAIAIAEDRDDLGCAHGLRARNEWPLTPKVRALASPLAPPNVSTG